MVFDGDKAETIQNALLNLVRYDQCDFIREYTGDEWDAEVTSGANYEDAGVLTMDKGLVMRLSDGTEVMVTIQVYSH